MRPKTDLTKEEIESGKYVMEETYFVNRKFGKAQKDCFEEGPIERENLDIKKFSFDRLEAEKNYVNFNGPYPPEIKEWMTKNPTLVFPDKVLSDQAYDFLRPYISGAYMIPGKKVTLRPAALKNLLQFRLDKPIRLFRGIHFGFAYFDMIEQFCALHMDPSKSYTFREDKPSSWTWNYTMAENFAKIGSFGFVLSRVFQPEEILIDLRLCKEYFDIRGQNKLALQDEVIVMPGAYKCEIVLPFPSGVKNGLAKPENLSALKKIKNFYNKNKAEPKIEISSYGRDYFGLTGKISILSVALVFDFDFDPKTQSPKLYYGLNTSLESLKDLLIKKLDKYAIKRFDSTIRTYFLNGGKECPELDVVYKQKCFKVTTSNSAIGSLDTLINFLEKLTKDLHDILTK